LDGEGQILRPKAGIVAAVLAAATTLIYVGPASGQQADGPNCSDFPTQIDIPNSILGDLDPTDLDENDNGVGCEARPAPPKAYDLTKNPPVLLEPEPEPEPPAPAESAEPPPATTTKPAAPAQPVTAAPDFTG
jgi:hypothetical protein